MPAKIKTDQSPRQGSGRAPQPMLNFDRAKLKKFKAAYDQHKDDPDRIFEFEGHEFLAGYARHLIEYLETKFKGD